MEQSNGSPYRLAPASGPGGRILLVDADPIRRATNARALLRAGHSVEVASCGDDAVARLRAAAFDVVLNEQPGIGGLELLRAVRGHTPVAPAVLMSGEARVEVAIEALTDGAFRFLSNPLDTARLEKAVAHALQSSAARGAPGVEAGVPPPITCDHAWLDLVLDAAIERLRIVYQPIVSWTARRNVAFEALARGGIPELERPDALFDLAESLGRVRELGRAIRRKVAADVHGLPDDITMFVNLHASDLDDEDLFAPDAPLSTVGSRVVLEITERASLHDVPDLAGKTRELRSLGFRMAVDDLGAGYGSLATMAAVAPDVVKLDRSIIREVADRRVSRHMVRALTRMSHELQMLVVAEGVETERERQALVELDCDLLQGFLFARPAAGFVDPVL